MENDYNVIENAQGLFKQYLENPKNCNLDSVGGAVSNLEGLLLRTEHPDIRKKGVDVYLQFFFESDFFPREMKRECMALLPENTLSSIGLAVALKTVH